MKLSLALSFVCAVPGTLAWFRVEVIGMRQVKRTAALKPVSPDQFPEKQEVIE